MYYYYYDSVKRLFVIEETLPLQLHFSVIFAGGFPVINMEIKDVNCFALAFNVLRAAKPAFNGGL